MAISRFYVLIAFAACAAQLAFAGVVPEARDLAARAPSYVVNEVREHRHKQHGRDDADVEHKKHHKHHGRDDADVEHKKHHKHHARDDAEVNHKHKKHPKHHARDDAEVDDKHKKHDKDHKKPHDE
ncbi:uncharacterized protein LACBIDRAFT_312251 [Laccaria bicolor S238N-H82]|uniref:Predicted protein n=1 Tax=Laccaria bicolor (strain S238N-H82 / ATCC MYA-4686) TaxID=486041 RepID=B0DVT4_LACBS|nr:uncharacterized protein LACBIDRAFT_312251 [Laccaria bicolor S238N-H82]EDR01356.1 predicted protein [Laccaria bicolor S238N-H82]|eukprot:XP_001888063.1 predicted protein [Laccaria bicolor S238N-H82]